MPLLRSTARFVLVCATALVLVPVIGEWFVKLADERGFYAKPSSRLERAIMWLASWADLPGFKFVAGLVLGLTIGLWLDRWLRIRERGFSPPAWKASVYGRPAKFFPSDSGRACFDYTTNDGLIGLGRGPHTFRLCFSAHGSGSIRLSKLDTDLKLVANLQGLHKEGRHIEIASLETGSRETVLRSGERFAAQNGDGSIIQGIIESISFEGRGGSDRNEVCLRYLIDRSGRPDFLAMT